MVDPDRFAESMRTFAGSMARSYDITEMCYELCDRVIDVLGVAGAGVSVAGAGGNLRFVTATSSRIAAMEKAQEEAQQGPSVMAFGSERSVVVEGSDGFSDWPRYGATAERLGLQAVVSHPLAVPGHRIGALNVYDDRPRPWSDEELSSIGVFADMATAYLVRMSEIAEARSLAEQLGGALESRVVIEQAKGVLADQLGVGVDEAFRILRNHARHHHLKLPHLAEAVVTTGLRIPQRGEG